MSNNKVLKFQKECFARYFDDIRKSIPEFPQEYIFPDGNPISPVLPIQTEPKKIMLIGAFPSARFERRNTVLIPVGNNLSPFGFEKYFDGREIRTQASRDSLDRDYFRQLCLRPEELWITDLVKIYLYPDKHIRNCKTINPRISYVNTHKLFPKIAHASMDWMKREIAVCNPELIITLGEVPARVISENNHLSNKELLNGDVRTYKWNDSIKIAHLGHPEIRRRSKDWDDWTVQAIDNLRNYILKMEK